MSAVVGPTARAPALCLLTGLVGTGLLYIPPPGRAGGITAGQPGARVSALLPALPPEATPMALTVGGPDEKGEPKQRMWWVSGEDGHGAGVHGFARVRDGLITQASVRRHSTPTERAPPRRGGVEAACLWMRTLGFVDRASACHPSPPPRGTKGSWRFSFRAPRKLASITLSPRGRLQCARLIDPRVRSTS